MSAPEEPSSPDRRRFLALAGSLGVAAGGSLLLPGQARADSPPLEWQNWSGGQKARPANMAYPDSEEALATAIRSATAPIRAVGGSHSFSPVVSTPGTIISLEALNGMVAHDPKAQTATFRAGTRVAATGPALKAVGQGLLNEADINLQSLGGAISTSTHGTGRLLKSYSGNVTHLRLFTADGSAIDCSADTNRDIFDAARVAVGSLGILSQVTLQNRTAYRLRETVRVSDVQAAMAAMEAERDRHRHIEIFVFPFGGKAIVKRMNITTDAPTPVVPADDNELLDFAADTARKYPWTNAWVQRLVGMFISDSERVGDSFDVLASPRTVAFNEMEYTVPAERGLECLEEVNSTIRRAGINVFFPLEFRYTAADDCWLSPFSERPGASISVHQYHKQDYRPLFRLVEPIFWKYQGRPHWGKLHTLTAKNLRAVYPRFDDFLRVRRELDPQGRFLNPHARQLFLG
ncbi:MAG: FAD-linked oxidoreductase subfamily [Moraxellaceae bacterium]|jgi:FAD-linked oxidoreductase|nr:FAD-linked oxidoreductase subfamily [Moraxellaceae bacterium]